MEDHTSTNKKRVRDNSDDSVHDSAEVKRLREDLLGFLDDSDADPTTQDLDSIMKSFEEEIAAATTSCQSSPRPASETLLAPVPVVDLTSESGESKPDLGYLLESESGESKPDLGYLLEASDDELGLPPSENFNEEAAKGGESELVRVPSDSSVADELWQFDDPPPSTLDGLFGNDDVYFDSADYGEFSWRFGTLPAQ